jgi:hypothetical protein
MNILVNIGLGAIGFSIGNLLFAKVGRWLMSAHEIITEPQNIEAPSKAARLASATLLSSGPWFAGVVAVLAYYVHAESWSLPIFVGAVVAIAFFGVLAIYLARKAVRSGAKNAA